MSILLLFARLILAAIFAVAAITKLIDPAGSRKSMADFGMPAVLAAPLGWIVPLIEMACAVALIPRSWAWWGASGILALLILFIPGIGFNLAMGRKPDCHCFGQLHSKPIGWETIARDAVLAVPALFIVWQGKDHTGASVLGLAGFSGTQVALPALGLAVLGLGALQVWALIHVLRQNGRLLLRIESLEARAGGRAEPPPAGLPVNTIAPSFSLKDLNLVSRLR